MSNMHLQIVTAADSGDATDGATIMCSLTDLIAGGTDAEPAHDRLHVSCDLQPLTVAGLDAENLNTLSAPEKRRLVSRSQPTSNRCCGDVSILTSDFRRCGAGQMTQSRSAWRLTCADKARVIAPMPNQTAKTWKLGDVGTVHDKDDHHDVGCSLPDVLVGAISQKDTATSQVHVIAPDVRLKDPNIGTMLASAGKLY